VSNEVSCADPFTINSRNIEIGKAITGSWRIVAPNDMSSMDTFTVTSSYWYWHADAIDVLFRCMG